MILHLAPDEKFIDMAFRAFESVKPGFNRVYVITECDRLNYVKSEGVVIINSKRALEQDFLEFLLSFDFVVLHSLTQVHIQILLRASSKIKFLWLGWGYDYYNRFGEGEKALLLPLTNSLFIKNQSIFQFLKERLASLKRWLFIKDDLFHKSLLKIDFFAPVLPNEYDFCKKKFNNLKAKFVSWNYGILEEDFSVSGLEVNGENILLGNSASYENNHLDAIESLEKMGGYLPEKIFVPLSYGDIDYRNLIIKQGKLKLGNRFFPLIEFMPPEKYWQTIASCKYVLMNHLRQQAIANIVMMMNLGASIFLDVRNPAYSFFYQNGLHLFNKEDFFSSKQLNDFSLNKGQILKNREFIKENWGREAILRRTEKLIKEITSYSKSGK